MILSERGASLFMDKKIELVAEISLIDKGIEDLNLKITDLKKKKTAMNKEIRKLDVMDKIKRFESTSINANNRIESLVRVGETKEEWIERFGKYCVGAKDASWLDKIYDDGGFVDSTYIKWLLEVNDLRIQDTIIHQK